MIQKDISSKLRHYWSRRRTVPGHLYGIDFLVFDRLLSWQEDQEIVADLVEIGAYLGKSAIVIGAHQRPGEAFLVCDVFERPEGEHSNVVENSSSYGGLTRAAFEANYARFNDGPPTIVQALSNTISLHARPRSVRFAHIDGGHLYETVKNDLNNALVYLHPDGIVCMDDVRSQHTPGVAAATWESVANGSLHPICATEIKLYLSPSRHIADMAVEHLDHWFSQHREIEFGRQTIHGRSLIVVRDPHIPTTRGRVKSLIPPFVLSLLAPRPPAHLGD